MPEEEAFAVMVKLMQDYRLREMFKPSMAELGLCMYQLKNLVEVCNSPSNVNASLAAVGYSRAPRPKFNGRVLKLIVIK